MTANYTPPPPSTHYPIGTTDTDGMTLKQIQTIAKSVKPDDIDRMADLFDGGSDTMTLHQDALKAAVDDVVTRWKGQAADAASLTVYNTSTKSRGTSERSVSASANMRDYAAQVRESQVLIDVVPSVDTSYSTAVAKAGGPAGLMLNPGGASANMAQANMAQAKNAKQAATQLKTMDDHGNQFATKQRASFEHIDGPPGGARSMPGRLAADPVSPQATPRTQGRVAPPGVGSAGAAYSMTPVEYAGARRRARTDDENAPRRRVTTSQAGEEHDAGSATCNEVTQPSATGNGASSAGGVGNAGGTGNAGGIGNAGGVGGAGSVGGAAAGGTGAHAAGAPGGGLAGAGPHEPGYGPGPGASTGAGYGGAAVAAGAVAGASRGRGPGGRHALGEPGAGKPMPGEGSGTDSGSRSGNGSAEELGRGARRIGSNGADFGPDASMDQHGLGRAGSPGRGARGGALADETELRRNSPGAAGSQEFVAGEEAEGGRPGMAGGTGRRRDDDDELNRRPDYLVEPDDLWGDGRLAAPPVLG